MITSETPTRIATLIATRIDQLAGRKSQRDIAREAGFKSQNMISMLKKGESKLPIDRVPGLARALEVDPAHMFRLALEQFFSENAVQVVNELFGTVVTKNETAILSVIREASQDTDPQLTPERAEALRRLFG